MSVSAVGGVSSANQQDKPPPVAPVTPVASFSQHVDIEATKLGAAHGHHHHHSGASQSVTRSAATAASAAGAAPTGTVASSLLNLIA